MKAKLQKSISEESTKDLINIHNFLTAISLNDEENTSVFTLMCFMHSELQGRKDAKPYIDALTKLLDAPTYENTTK